MRAAKWIWGTGLSILPFVFWEDIYEGSLFPRLLALQLTLLVIAVWNLLRKDRQVVPRKLLALSTCWGLALALSVFQAINRTEALAQLSQYLALSFLPVLLVSSLGARDLRLVARAISIASVPISLIGICQYLGIAFLDLPSQALPSATFFHRNPAATYLTAVIPIAGLCFVSVRRTPERGIHAAACWLALVFLVFTRTRGAWVGAAVASVIVILLTRIHNASQKPSNERTSHLVFALLALITIIGAGYIPDQASTVRPTFDDKKSTAAEAVTSIFSAEGHRGRPQFWLNTIRMISDHPVLGVGIGNWEFHYPEYARGDQVNRNAAPRRPHNDLLWLASETGGLGLAAYLCLIGISIWVGIQAILKGSADQRRMALAALFVVIAHLVNGMFNFPRERVGGASLFWLAIGSFWLIQQRREGNAAFPRAYAWAMVLILVWSVQLTVRRMAYDYHHLRVHIAERSMDWQKVLDHGEKAIQFGSFRANTWIAMGRAYYRRGDTEAAIESHERALTLHPNSLNAHNNLGIAYRKAERTNEAILSLRRAIQLFPDFIEAHNNLGNALRDDGQIDASIETFETILWNARSKSRRKVTFPQVYTNLAQSYVARGDLHKARVALMSALEIDPNNKAAQHGLRRLQRPVKQPSAKKS
jgi:O-antigen ligase/Tfp pilus assembly protein PilF